MPNTHITSPDNIEPVSNSETRRSIPIPTHVVIQRRDGTAQHAPSRLVVVGVPCEEANVADTRPRDTALGDQTVAHLREECGYGAGCGVEHASDGNAASIAVYHGQDNVCLSAGSTP